MPSKFGNSPRQKLLVGKSHASVDIVPAHEVKSPHEAMWEIVHHGKYSKIKNRRNGNYIVRDDNHNILTSDTAADNGKWHIDLATHLSTEDTKVADRARALAWTNKGGKLSLSTNKTSSEVVEQADQLFKFTYAGHDDEDDD